MGQPGMSVTLMRLRKVFKDNLLVKQGGAVVPTQRARALEPEVRREASSNDSPAANSLQIGFRCRRRRPSVWRLDRHRCYTADPALQWLREAIASVRSKSIAAISGRHAIRRDCRSVQYSNW
jgi:hypothetical protein